MTPEQHIPTAFPTDTELLNLLEACVNPLRLQVWVCHRTEHGRIEILQTTQKEAALCDWDAHATVREAIAAAMGLTKGE